MVCVPALSQDAQNSQPVLGHNFLYKMHLKSFAKVLWGYLKGAGKTPRPLKNRQRLIDRCCDICQSCPLPQHASSSPELGGDENVFTPGKSSFESLGKCTANWWLIPIMLSLYITVASTFLRCIACAAEDPCHLISGRCSSSNLLAYCTTADAVFRKSLLTIQVAPLL